MRTLLITFFLLISLSVIGQKTIRKSRLPKELNEISGLEKFNDTILIAINDGGNDPIIYFLDLNGRILKKTVVKDVVNRDWEDLTMDGNRDLYIADVGNNAGTYTSFQLLKLSADVAFQSDTISSEILEFVYPAGPLARTPDCEAIFWYNDTLHLLTKNHIKHFRGNLRFYKKQEFNRQPRQVLLADSKSLQTAIESPQFFSLFIPKVKKRGIRDLVTAADQKEGVLALLTYSKLYTYNWTEKTVLGERRLTRAWGNLRFVRLTQKEAVVIMSEKKIMVAAERHPLLGGPFLYTIHLR